MSKFFEKNHFFPFFAKTGVFEENINFSKNPEFCLEKLALVLSKIASLKTSIWKSNQKVAAQRFELAICGQPKQSAISHMHMFYLGHQPICMGCLKKRKKTSLRNSLFSSRMFCSTANKMRFINTFLNFPFHVCRNLLRWCFPDPVPFHHHQICISGLITAQKTTESNLLTCGCRNVVNCPYKSMACNNITNWP